MERRCLYRLAPYQYSDNSLVRGASGPRRLTSDEQLRMLGFNSDHLGLKQKVTEDQKQQMLRATLSQCWLLLDSWPTCYLAHRMRRAAALAMSSGTFGKPWSHVFHNFRPQDGLLDSVCPWWGGFGSK